MTKGTARDAYNEAVEEMNDYNGHQEGYSGDIQTTHGFNMRSPDAKYGTKAFDEWENVSYELMHKGDCFCVEITSPSTLKKLKGNRWKGKKGVKAYYFFGMARC